MNNEPVAWIDKNTGKPRMEGFIQTDHDIPLYTHPVSQYQSITNTKIEPTVVSYTHPIKEHDIGISHAIGFDDGFKAGMQRAVEMNVVKELTDSELTDIWKNKLCNQDCPREVYLAFYKEIRKAQKK